MRLDDLELWSSLEQLANENEAFDRKAKSLSPLTIRFAIDESNISLHVANGHARVTAVDDLRGYDLRISGPREEWERLLTGVISYPQAVNHAQGRLRIDGDLVASAWATPIICEFLRKMPQLLAEEA